MELLSERLQVEDSLEAFNRAAEEQGWSDGLPLVPPTPARVAAMIAGGKLEAGHSFGPMPPYMGDATVEKLAVNAVMAGARPAWFPVICAAVAAAMDPAFNLYAVQTTTSPATPMVVVNGPARAELGFNSAGNCLGPGWPANATVGRALRLAMQNVGGGRPAALGPSPSGVPALDYATHGFPGKYGMCTAENEEESPWEPLHVERGLGPDDDAVTVIAVDSTWEMRDNASQTAVELLTCLAVTMAGFGTANMQFGGQPAVAFAPELAHLVASDGWTKQDVKRFLFENARLDLARLPENQRKRHLIVRSRWAGQDRLPLCDRPEDIVVLVLGGAGIHEVFLPTFGSSRPVTRRIY